MSKNHSIQSIYSHLRRFTPLHLCNQLHKNELRRILEKESAAETTAYGKPFPWLKFAVPALAAGIVIIMINLAIILPAFFSQTDLARLYKTYDQAPQQEKGFVFDKDQGTPLNPGTVYRTSDAKTQLIVFKENTTIQIFTNTEFMLTELTQTESCLLASLYLRHGILEYDSQHAEKPLSFSLVTNSASIEPIGTHFRVQVDRDNTLHVEVHKGRVRINHLHSVLGTVKKSVLSEEEKHNLEALFLSSCIILMRGQTYTAYYDEISLFQERISSLIVNYSQSSDEKEKQTYLTQINSYINLIYGKLQKSIPSIEGTASSSASAEQEGTQTDLFTNATAAQQEKPARGAHYVLSTLEADDPYKNLWSFSGPKNLFSISSEHAFSRSHALKIAVENPVSEIFAWYLTLADKLPLNKEITLKVSVKTDNLRGQGVALTVRADETAFPANRILLFNTTRDQLVITGSSDWQEYSLALKGKIPMSAKSISIYLLYLPRTTGSVYFDDIGIEFN
jgi:hypothetical protein